MRFIRLREYYIIPTTCLPNNEIFYIEMVSFYNSIVHLRGRLDVAIEQFFFCGPWRRPRDDWYTRRWYCAIVSHIKE